MSRSVLAALAAGVALVAPTAALAFCGFYVSGADASALLQRTVERNPRTVVTEYSWDASTCDPCPTEPLNPQELTTLGSDVIPNQPTHGFVLTRLHYRYTETDLGEDLVFRAATPIVGGRGMPDAEANLEQGVSAGPINNFQGRYVILHPWDGPMECESPQRGQWGGPPNGQEPRPLAAGSRLSSAPANTAPAQLGTLVAQDVPEIGLVQGDVAQQGGTVVVDRGPSSVPRAAEGEGGGCASCAVGDGAAPFGSLAIAALVALFLLRRRER